MPSSRRSRNLAPLKLSSWSEGSADTVLRGCKRQRGTSSEVNTLKAGYMPVGIDAFNTCKPVQHASLT
jgi:hypothetical protein